jgi:hypothetical protein
MEALLPGMMSGSMRPDDQNPQYTFYGSKMLTADDPDLLTVLRIFRRLAA